MRRRRQYNSRYGLVGHWAMNGNAKDSSINKYDGAVTGASLTTNRFGQSNRAYLFTNGANNKIEANVPASHFQNGFTISAWTNPASAGELTGRIFDKSEFQNAQNGLTYFMSANRVGFINNNGTIIYSNNNSINYNQWQHVLVTVNSSGLVTHYINGTVSGTGTTGVPSGITTTNALAIGNRSRATDRDFDGKISDVRFYNRILTPAQITRLYKENS